MNLHNRVAEYEAALGDPSHRNSSLTQREHDVLALLASGSTNQEIATQLHLSAKTVERHLTNLYRKLGVTNRTEAATYAIRNSIGS
jgi:DNA-binding NarL/FixJ family response regulator